MTYVAFLGALLLAGCSTTPRVPLGAKDGKVDSLFIDPLMWLASVDKTPTPNERVSAPEKPAPKTPQPLKKKEPEKKLEPKPKSPDVAIKHAASVPSIPLEKQRVNKRYPLRWPVSGAILSRFGEAREGHDHDGIDIGAPFGTKVCAAADGDVLYSELHGAYGNLVVIKHNGGVFTVYAHHEVNLVQKGQKVHAGDVIARVGQTGRATTPHLHFEVRKGSRPENPLQFLPP
jgi:lipoprotein NlpD